MQNVFLFQYEGKLVDASILFGNQITWFLLITSKCNTGMRFNNKTKAKLAEGNGIINCI